MMGLDLLMPQDNDSKFYGVTIGIVTNNNDPENLGRIKVKFPWLSEEDESPWARLLTPMAGKNRGFYFLPEINDEVLVAFEQGDMAFPYILGALWNAQDLPPEKNKDGKNNIRTIKSRSGHKITLDDTDGQEKIIIEDKTGKNQILINSQDNTINITSEKDLAIVAKGNISFKSSDGDIAIECQNLSIKTKAKYQLEAKSDCTIKTKAKYQLESSTGLGIKCAKGVKINDTSLEVM